MRMRQMHGIFSRKSEVKGNETFQQVSFQAPQTTDYGLEDYWKYRKVAFLEKRHFGGKKQNGVEQNTPQKKGEQNDTRTN